MNEKPTLSDYQSWLKFLLGEAQGRARAEFDRIVGEAAKRGVSQSPMAMRQVFEAMNAELDRGIDTALGELMQAARRTELDQVELRSITLEELHTFADGVKGVTGFAKGQRWGRGESGRANEMLAELDQRLEFAIRQYDVGFLQPEAPETPLSMTNTVNIGTMAGGGIMQGSAGSSQTIGDTTFNAEALKVALGDVRSELGKVELPDDVRVSVHADLDTIAAQLVKPEVSAPVVREAGRSLRSVMEGVAAGLLTPGAQAALVTLLTALGV